MGRCWCPCIAGRDRSLRPCTSQQCCLGYPAGCVCEPRVDPERLFCVSAVCQRWRSPAYKSLPNKSANAPIVHGPMPPPTAAGPTQGLTPDPTQAPTQAPTQGPRQNRHHEVPRHLYPMLPAAAASAIPRPYHWAHGPAPHTTAYKGTKIWGCRHFPRPKPPPPLPL